MGRPIKIYEIIKKMFNTFKVPNQKLKVLISGNKFNEKISEKLSIGNKIEKTKIHKIFCIKDNLPDKNLFYKNYQKMLSDFNTNNLNKLLKKMVS